MHAKAAQGTLLIALQASMTIMPQLLDPWLP